MPLYQVVILTVHDARVITESYCSPCNTWVTKLSLGKREEYVRGQTTGKDNSHHTNIQAVISFTGRLLCISTQSRDTVSNLRQTTKIVTAEAGLRVKHNLLKLFSPSKREYIHKKSERLEEVNYLKEE